MFHDLHVINPFRFQKHEGDLAAGVCRGRIGTKAFEHHRRMARLRPAGDGKAEEKSSDNENEDHEKKRESPSQQYGGWQTLHALILHQGAWRDCMPA